MRGVILGGLLIVFIASLSIMFIFDNMIRNTLQCIDAFSGCSPQSEGITFIVGVALATLFMVIAMATMYIMFTRSSRDTFRLPGEAAPGESG